MKVFHCKPYLSRFEGNWILLPLIIFVVIYLFKSITIGRFSRVARVCETSMLLIYSINIYYVLITVVF